MSRLLIKPTQPDEQGCIQNITPESAGWNYVGFRVYRLNAGQCLSFNSDSLETCAVIVSGTVNASTPEQQWNDVGVRDSPFEGKPPHALYTPPRCTLSVEATRDTELAVCQAPAEGQFPARLISPDQCSHETRGTGTNQRHVCNILFNNAPEESLLVVEVITPNGNWSSYPPHKHDDGALPGESQLEETYYHRVNPPQGFAFQRVYTDDRRIDETMTIEDRNVVLVPEGYHPVGAAHGYDLYYLNVMAGPTREWLFRNDPQHEWMI